MKNIQNQMKKHINSHGTWATGTRGTPSLLVWALAHVCLGTCGSRPTLAQAHMGQKHIGPDLHGHMLALV